MKYHIIQCATTQNDKGEIKTNYTSVDSKDTLKAAIIRWHGLAAALWNDPTTLHATVAILDENLDRVEGNKYTEVIDNGIVSDNVEE